MKKLLKNKFFTVVAAVVLLALSNYLISKLNIKFDLTTDNKYSVSKPVKNQLNELPQKVTAYVLLQKNVQKDFTRLANYTADILRLFRQYSHGKFSYKFVDPNEKVPNSNTSFADSALALGYNAINLKSQIKQGEEQKLIYPIALLISDSNYLQPIYLFEGKRARITEQDLVDASSLIEFNLAKAIRDITQPDNGAIAYENGHGEPTDFTTFDLSENVLKPNYYFNTINIKNYPFIPPQIKTLLIVKPKTEFSDIEKLKLDQFLMNGGNLLFFIDRLEAEHDSLQIKNQVIAYDRNLKLDDLLFRYGIRVQPNLIMDLQCDSLPQDVNGDGQFEFVPWNYYPLLQSANNHPINKNLGLVLSKFANNIEFVNTNSKLQSKVLLHSSYNSRTIGTPALISGKENVFAPVHEKYRQQNIPAAVIVEGEFTSHYTNQQTPAMLDTFKKYNVQFKEKSNGKGKLIYVADADLILNDKTKDGFLPMGVNKYAAIIPEKYYQFANKNFLENCLHYVQDESGILESKNKDFVVRPLDIVKLEEEKSKWQFINIFLPILLLILFAFLNKWWRSVKYK